MLGLNNKRILVKTVFLCFFAIVLGWGLVSCGDRIKAESPAREVSRTAARVKLSEVAPPNIIQQLDQALENYQPQVTILSPRPDKVLEDTTVKVTVQVRGLPIFKDEELGMGPHLKAIVDNHLGQEIYDLEQPIVFEDLEPGTHTVRVFASRPWHESFKNEGAYAQTTFHIFSKTGSNAPDSSQPLLTYNSPSGRYGSEPILLDFYLTNAPLHLIARETPDDDVEDWRIRITADGQSFVTDSWQPLYLQGFLPGKNWVQVEYLDEQGQNVKNAFNNTVKLVTYEPGGEDTLSKLMRDELPLSEALAMVDPNYVKPIPPEESAIPEVGEPSPEEEISIPEPEAETSLPEVPTVIEEPITPPVEELEQTEEEAEQIQEELTPKPEAETSFPEVPTVIEEPIAPPVEELEQTEEEAEQIQEELTPKPEAETSFPEVPTVIEEPIAPPVEELEQTEGTQDVEVQKEFTPEPEIVAPEPEVETNLLEAPTVTEEPVEELEQTEEKLAPELEAIESSEETESTPEEPTTAEVRLLVPVEAIEETSGFEKKADLTPQLKILKPLEEEESATEEPKTSEAQLLIPVEVVEETPGSETAAEMAEPQPEVEEQPTASQRDNSPLPESPKARLKFLNRFLKRQ